MSKIFQKLKVKTRLKEDKKGFSNEKLNSTHCASGKTGELSKLLFELEV